MANPKEVLKMFDECFVDTACWVGLLNKDDEIHELADSKYRIMMKSGIHFVTTTAVLNEVANSLSDSREATFIFGDCVYHLILQHEISAIKITSNDHAKATEIMFDEMWKIAKTKNSLRKS